MVGESTCLRRRFMPATACQCMPAQLHTHACPSPSSLACPPACLPACPPACHCLPDCLTAHVQEECEFLIAESADGKLDLQDVYVTTDTSGRSGDDEDAARPAPSYRRPAGLEAVSAAPREYHAVPWYTEYGGDIIQNKPPRTWVRAARPACRQHQAGKAVGTGMQLPIMSHTRTSGTAGAGPDARQRRAILAGPSRRLTTTCTCPPFP